MSILFRDIFRSKNQGQICEKGDDGLHQRIKELCKRKGVSINKLEYDLGFAKGYVSKLNTSIPSVENARKIAEYFGVSIDDLIKEEAKTGQGMKSANQ